MKNKSKFPVAIVLALILTTSRFFAQPSETSDEGVQLLLMTDRDLYISGEDIRFSILPVDNHMNIENLESRILYVELITPGGNKITGGKFSLENGKGSGCLNVPAEVISGEYYLRAYTKYMRNFGPDSYAGVCIKLINPVSNNILNGNGTAQTEGSVDIQPEQTADEIQVIKTDRKVYDAREKVDLHVEQGILKGMAATGWCLTVVPDGALDSANRIMDAGTASDNPKQDNFDLQYYPETRGISVSGKLVDKETGRPVQDGVVTLSIIGDRDFSAYRTGPEGQFYFSMPAYRGKRDIFLSSREASGKAQSILIDNDFCSVPVNLHSTAFSLTEKEKRAGLAMAVNAQVASAFQMKQANRSTQDTAVTISFYGDPTDVLVMDKYIQLPTMEEYFNELPMVVKIRERKGKKYFKFMSNYAEMMVYDPLVLVDWVVITETDKLLALSPLKISRIEIVNKPYVKGNLTYGGILSIISRQGDFAGIDLPASGVFVNYRFLADSCREISYPVAPRIPDSRNTLYWEPDLPLDTKDSGIISFTTADTPGDYLVVLRGVGKNGEIYRQTLTFRVNPQYRPVQGNDR